MQENQKTFRLRLTGVRSGVVLIKNAVMSEAEAIAWAQFLSPLLPDYFVDSIEGEMEGENSSGLRILVV